RSDRPGRGDRPGRSPEPAAPAGVATVSFEEAFDAEIGNEFGDLGPETGSTERSGDRRPRRRS
ncbi:MAG: hypothetical protein M3535_06055, partial [Actinomycetota bacterium]|nr:hypothetical protein [Actinomycetota bacterium]